MFGTTFIKEHTIENMTNIITADIECCVVELTSHIDR